MRCSLSLTFQRFREARGPGEVLLLPRSLQVEPLLYLRSGLHGGQQLGHQGSPQFAKKSAHHHVQLVHERFLVAQRDEPLDDNAYYEYGQRQEREVLEDVEEGVAHRPEDDYL
jgi:hypothetical protein